MRSRWRFVLFAVCMISGAVLFLYPWLCNRIYREQSRVLIQTYDEYVDEKDSRELEELRERARAYNRSLAQMQAVLTDPFLPEKDGQGQEQGGEILKLDESGQIGYIEIPCIDVKLPVFEGTDEETLKKGIGHLEGSSLPVGGTDTRTVLAGHTGMDEARLFTDLDKIQEQDVFYLYVLGERLAYRVVFIETVLPEETDKLAICQGKDLCTLVTCTPYGLNTHRLLVTGERITEETDALAETGTDEQVMYVTGGKSKAAALAAVASAGTLLYIRAKKYRKKSRRGTII